LYLDRSRPVPGYEGGDTTGSVVVLVVVVLVVVVLVVVVLVVVVLVVVVLVVVVVLGMIEFVKLVELY
jgi:hypothetical protein